MGVAYLVVSYGLMKGKGWAWSATMILLYILIVISVITIVGGDLSQIVNLLIIIALFYLLHRHESKAFFGKPPKAYI
jgi:hypothetical protein